ncbi:ABC-type antimicrobial peptide transport system permease subunit [Bacillus thermophilus]|uniref:ABC-type antimicrobial peptide transport system permease subunit n=1 Tax=Siminovitchia thermophila TaxID=1245522 RepID=A0ABS2RFI7_9BACI|nr:FtsX-like permease family protein [Siminovitchia thermophila]MBM7717628.1 ABC-type antimicrobial peptide transport system permease subunit [Siminovitchia thermophila]
MTLLKKSFYIIAYYMVVATFSCLAFSSLINSYERTAILPDGLSANSLRVTIQSAEEEIEKRTAGNLIEELESKSNRPFLLFKEVDMAYGKYFYLHQHDLPVSTVDWDQVPKEQPVAVLDKAMIHNVTEKNGKKYFRYNSRDYEVMDLFTPKEVMTELERSFFISLDPTINITGVYDIDGLSLNTVRQALISLQKDIPSLHFEVNPLHPSMKERIDYVIEDQMVIVVMLLVTMIFIGMSTIGTTTAWIDSRRDEIYARYLVGARFKDIQWWLLKDYLFVLIGSFAAGAVIAFLLIAVNAFDKVVNAFDERGLMVAFVFCLFIGILTLVTATWLSQLKKGIIRKESS